MVISQNGWPASAKASDFVPFAWVTGRVRPGDTYTVLNYLARRFDAEVEGIEAWQSWGWNYRDVRGATSLSNHASGTAVDFNATRHPLSRRGTFTPAQVAAIRRILSSLGGVVRWGGDYTGRADEMHFEINASSARVAAVARAIGAGAVSNPIGGGAASPTPTPGGSSPDPLTPIEEDDTMLVIARTKNDPQVWIGDGITRRRITTQDTLKTVQFLAAHGLLKVAQNGAVQSIEDLWALGHPVADDLGAVQVATANVPAGVWAHRLPHTLNVDADGKPVLTPAGDLLRYEPAEHEATRHVVAEIVKAVPGVDPNVIAAAVKAALANLSITLTTEG